MTKPPLPDHSSQEYLWWSQGAADEAAARDEGVNGDARQVRDLVESLARRHPEWTMEKLAVSVAKIVCPDKLRRRFR